MGTPEFAVETLDALVKGGYNVVAVVTQPDKPVGRHGSVLQPSQVKQYALEHALPVLQPVKMKDEEFVNQLRSYNANLQVVVAFRMLPEVVWAMPRFGTFSTHRSYFSWLCGKKEYVFDARVKGGERHMIMSGEYDKVLPMDIYGEYLIKAIIAGDIDKQEQLGIYEVAPEDFAVAEFVDSSKLELQSLVRKGLDTLRKENM